MRLRPSLLIVLVGLAAPVLTACGGSSPRHDVEPDKVVAIPGSPFKRVVLSPQAAQRIGIQTGIVRSTHVGRHRPTETVIPYAAVIYDNQGRAFTYTRPLPLQYVRRAIVIDHIAGGQVVLASGPPAGTRVVTVGAEELYGAELGVAE